MADDNYATPVIKLTGDPKTDVVLLKTQLDFLSKKAREESDELEKIRRIISWGKGLGAGLLLLGGALVGLVELLDHIRPVPDIHAGGK